MTNEFKVGLMVVAAGSLLMIAILFVTNFHFAPGGYVITAEFNFLGDLKENAPVEYAGGIKVGEVSAIRIKDGKAAVDLFINRDDFKLRRDSQVAIYSAGLLGSRYIQIASDLGTGELLKTGDVIEGLDANNLDKTFSQLGDVLETFEKMMGDPKAKENFLHSFDNMNKTTDNLLQLTIASRAKIEKILENLSNSSGKADKIIDSAQRVSKSLELLTASLDKNQVKESMNNLDITLKNMKQLTNDIHNGKGVVGVLMQDEKTADDIRDLVEDLKVHPWKLLWKK